MNDRITLNPKEFGDLAICAIRYCQGRRTYMPDLVRGVIKPHLQDLTNKDLQVMLNDCEEQARTNMYGSEVIDKPGWLQWRKELEDERNRRNDCNR